MNGDYMEIQYNSPKTGFITEQISAQTPQGAINLIRSRVPDARINWIQYHHSSEASAGRPDDRGWPGRR